MSLSSHKFPLNQLFMKSVRLTVLFNTGLDEISEFNLFSLILAPKTSFWWCGGKLTKMLSSHECVLWRRVAIVLYYVINILIC